MLPKYFFHGGKTFDLMISTLFIHWNHHHSSQSVKMNMYVAIIRTNHPELTALHFSETIHTSSAKKRYIMLLSCNMKVQKLLFLLSL